MKSLFSAFLLVVVIISVLILKSPVAVGKVREIELM
jgi:hypothetical protein